MAGSADSQDWERFKNVIRALYTAKSHKLEGPDGVIERMESRFGFKRTKAQYERQFKKWGFQKYRTKEDWKTMNQKIELRKRNATESNIYCDGELMSNKKLRKEISRQGYMTSTEQFIRAQEPPPQTPPGFDIRTPTAQPLFRLVFENLPILQFQAKIQPLSKSIRSFDTGLSALVPLLGNAHQPYNNKSALPIIESLLPNSALLDEVCATGLAIERVDQLGPVEFLNLSIFLISNNFPGKANREQLCKWLKDHVNPSVLKALSSMGGPTADALLENLFRFAVESEDIPTVKYLIKSGVNPNGHACRHSSIPDDLTPLQLACILGNIELIQELIQAGSSIDQPGTGWKSSALVLAIIGANLKKEDHNIYCQGDQEPKDDMASEESHLLSLTNSLIDSGAGINLDDTDKSCPASPRWPGHHQYLFDPIASITKVSHSPLTVAAKYKNIELVDFLIKKGADVKFRTNYNTSAIIECFDGCSDMNLFTDFKINFSTGETTPRSPKPVLPFSGCSLSKFHTVVRSLLEAGANANDQFKHCQSNWRSEEEHHYGYNCCETYTVLDLSVLTERVEVVGMMLYAGAGPVTENSMERAISKGGLEMICYLLNAGAPLSSEAVRGAMLRGGNVQFIEALLAKRQDIYMKEVVFVEALRRGDVSVLDYLFKDETCNSQDFIPTSLELTEAIQECCRSGNIDALRLILDKSSTYQFPISSWFGKSLIIAVSKGRDEVADALCSAGADINAIPLLLAIRKKNKRIVRNLISAGARLNTESKCLSCYGYHKVSGNILISAIEWGDRTVIEDLLQAGANIDALGTYSERWITKCCFNSNMTPLAAAILAKDSNLVRYLISAGAAVNFPRDCMPTCIGVTPLVAAILTNDSNLVRYLISAGAAINIPPDCMPNGNGITPLVAAIEQKDLDLVKYLIYEGAEINSLSGFMGNNDTYVTPLAAATSIGYFEVADSLIQAGANPYDDRALTAATNDLKLLQLLLTALHNWDQPSDRCQIGGRALYEAVWNNDQVMVRAILDSPLRDKISTIWLSFLLRNVICNHYRNLSIVRILIMSIADLNLALPSEEGHNFASSLWEAVEHGNRQVVEILLEAGAHPDIATCDIAYSPMQHAVIKGNQDIVQIFLDHGSNPDAALPHRNKSTPIPIAVDNQDMKMLRILLQYNYNPKTVFDDMKHTPLQTAARDGNKEMVELLLEHGADVNSPPPKRFGATALQFAAINGFAGIAYLLLQNGADVNALAAEIDGRTALEGAAEHGRTDMVQLLLNAEANIFGDGQPQYENAVRRASENGHHGIRRLLESYHG
ncbi:uncharacterized protein BP5553_01623 [Venustampulla echinocandica]|uniref:Clr5 domain-containing protein n=1 Tax=Venustampulla echinocandica TaxID=2656787 RepID=A0A370U1J6_9HELO|nr:uncharacterized protein BP5553_01623 [Venustampulla echinocandica]RDL41644.1 hypothetical protein BP5553_01623 [Venustampulla echinocandica]